MLSHSLSVYGRTRNDWEELAAWVCDNDLDKVESNRFMIQVPRIYRVFKKIGAVKTFGETLANIFVPMFEATSNPDKHPKLARFLAAVSGFDSVDDESLPDLNLENKNPMQWESPDNPPYRWVWEWFEIGS